MGTPVDTTGDGRPDAIGYDTNGDGRLDHLAPMGGMMYDGVPAGMPGMPGVPGVPGMPPPGGPQKLKVAVPPGLQGGMTMQVQTPTGLMNVPIPAGLQPGQEFEFMM